MEAGRPHLIWKEKTVKKPFLSAVHWKTGEEQTLEYVGGLESQEASFSSGAGKLAVDFPTRQGLAQC